MYCEHFGLLRPPFKITPDTRHFYTGSNRGDILQALIYTITRGEGIVKVVGEVGSGKTMLCRTLEEHLPKNVEVVYLDNPSLSPDNILHAIAIEIGLSVRMQDNHFEVMKLLQDYLLKEHENNKQVVIFVEEAQGMPIETLEEIRLLSNLETQQHKLLQIVLFGQPELDNNLSKQNIRQLRDRITHRFSLDALKSRDVKDYLMSRMRVAGYRGPDIFSAAAIRLITRASKGLMRRINILADKSLLAAYADSEHGISTKHVSKAIKDCEFSSHHIFMPAMAAAVVSLVCVIAFAAYFASANNEMAVVIPQTSNGSTVNDKTTQNQLIIENSQHDATKIRKDQDILREKVLKTKRWLASANKNHYSIQVLQTSADFKKELQGFLRKQVVGGNLEKLFIYQTKINGRLMYGVLYDEFVSYIDALKALETMPVELKNNKPFLRSIHKLREEVAASDLS